MSSFVNMTILVGLNLFLDPNTTAIEHVLTFHLLYRHLLYRHLLYYLLLCFHLLYRHWIIPPSTRPSLDLRSPSAVIIRGGSELCYTVKGNGLTKLINKITNETSGVLGSIGTKGLHRSKRNVKRSTNATEVSIQSEGASIANGAL